MVPYADVFDFPREVVVHLACLVADRRRDVHTPQRSRALTPFQGGVVLVIRPV